MKLFMETQSNKTQGGGIVYTYNNMLSDIFFSVLIEYPRKEMALILTFQSEMWIYLAWTAKEDGQKSIGVFSFLPR